MAAAPLSVMKYTGVRLRKWGKYVSEIRLPNSRERIWLGSYDSAEKAARAFDAAMFCLRGPTARFNFPDNPPNIADGQGLQPEQIQAVAQSYANSYDDCAHGGDSEPSQSPPSYSGETAVIDWSSVLDFGTDNVDWVFESPPSNSEGTAAIDWSFLGALDSGYDHAGRVFESPLSNSEGTAAMDWSFLGALDSGYDHAGRVFESPPSNSEGTAAMDWSFLGALDSGYDYAGRVFDFSYYEQPPEYSPHFAGGCNDDDGNGDGGHELYYDLWSYDHY